MKRYNIHLPEEWTGELDKITEKVGKEIRKKNSYLDVKKSDIIRIGISLLYGLKLPYSFGGSETVVEAIKKMFKK